MKLLCLSCFVLLFHFSYACLNEEHVNKSGQYASMNFSLEGAHFYKRHNTIKLEAYLKELQQKQTQDANNTFKNENSIAVTLIKLGRLQQAEEILNRLYQQQPNNYSINANLGTLYELQGKNEKALEFIKRSIQINPNSHDGSEWFHVAVLEFKLKNIPEKEIATTNILNLEKKKRNASVVAHQIMYQLQERIPFMPAPNMLIAKILDEYAGFLADNVSIKTAYLMYSIAEDYDTAKVLQLSQKKTALKRYFKKYKQQLPVVEYYYFDPAAEAQTKKSAGGVSEIHEETNTLALKEEKGISKNVLAWGGGIMLASAAILYRSRRKNA